MSKIIGNPVGTTLPKPDWKQTDPTKGDYIKNKPEVINPVVGELLAVKTVDSDGHVSEFESVEISIPSIDGLATTDYVDEAVSGLVDSAPDTLNTLNELAAALGDDANFATTITNQIGGKVDKVNGKGLSTNDYTTAEKNKLAGIAEGANKTTVDSALSTSSTNPVQNKVVNAALAGKADSGHNHDDRYYTETEINTKFSNMVGNTSVADQINTAVSSIKAGTVAYATNADHALSADEADHATSATEAYTAERDGSGNVITNTYATKEYVDDLGIYSGFYFKNAVSTLAGGMTDTDGEELLELQAQQTNEKIRFVAGNNLINFEATDYNGEDEVIITVHADPEGSADAALEDAKDYADKIKNDLLNGAGAAYDTLKELGDLIDDNQDAISALETVAAGKADAEHGHDIADVSGLQSALDSKAASSHGTHVSYSTTAPVMDGTASVGSASTVARSDHKHPTDTSRAAASDLTSHTGNTTVHITSTERTNWNAAKTHADATHAPSNAQANVIESIKVNGTAQTITSKSVNITVPTDNKDLANGAGYLVASDIANKANKATTLAGYGITDAASKTHTHDDRYYTESEVNELISNAVAQKSAVQFITWEAND